MSSHFRPPNLALTSIGLGLATFMQVLDTAIANVSLPTIAGNLNVSVNQSTWVITSFAVSQAIGLPLTGWLGRRFGEVKVFVWCTLLFVLAPFACGMAQSMAMLIFFRVLQGAMCGPMYPVTQSLMIAVYPPEKRGMALALISMVTVVAPVVGPILGGYITESSSWRWIFFINVPIGFFCSFTVRHQLKNMVEKIEKPRMDYVGLVTLIIGVGLLQVVLDKGNDVDWFGSTFIVAASVIAAIALAVFLIWELTDSAPIVNLKLLRHRNFGIGTLAFVLAYAAFFGIALLLPLWMQQDLGYTAIWAGLATSPVGIIPLLTTYFIGKYAARVDLRWMATLSFAAMSMVCFRYASFNLDVDFVHIALNQLLLGVGVAFFFMPLLTILLSDIDLRDIASGSGLATFLRTVGASFAVSLATFLWTRRASLHHAQLTENITPYNPLASASLDSLGSAHHQQALASLNLAITQQGFQMAFNEIFHLLGWVFLALIGVIWLTRPPFIRMAAKPGAASGH